MKHKVEHLAHRAFGIAPPRLDMRHGVHAPGAGFGGQLGQHRFRAPAPQHQPRAARPQVGIEADKAMMQPPPRRRPHPPVPGRLVIELIDRHDRPFRQRSQQRWLVRQPQIAAQPEEGGTGHI